MIDRPEYVSMQYGCTALIFSAINDHSDCVDLLVEAGADKEAKENVRDIRTLISVQCFCNFSCLAAVFSPEFSIDLFFFNCLH
jgi:hypothetical protein